MRRLNYILKRLLQMLPVLLVVTIMTFLMIHLIPGDPARIMAGEKARPDAVEAMRIKLGLDRPLWEQYWIYLKNLVTLDLGTSMKFSRPVAEMIGERLPVTVALTLFSTFLGLNTHYFVTTREGVKAEIVQESQIDSIIPKGEHVRLTVKREKINVMTEDGNANILNGVQNDLEQKAV